MFLIACAGAGAQNISSVMVGTVPSGVAFSVDGVTYVKTQTFLWPADSKHVIQFQFSQTASGTILPYQLSQDGMTEFFFTSWVATGTILPGNTPAVTVTAEPSLTSVLASLSAEYQVTVNFPAGSAPTCSGAPGNPSSAGTGYQNGIVYFGGTCIATSTALFLPAGPLTLVEFPYPGWVFYGWEIGDFNYGGIGSFNLIGPTNFTPQFTEAERVNFMTNPAGLQVLVDRTLSVTPVTPASNGSTCTNAQVSLPPSPPPGAPALCAGSYDFLPGSTHTVGAPTPQRDAVGNYWVFEGYTDGLGQNANYVAPSNYQPATLTAGFVLGVQVQFITSQNGLKLSIDGQTNYGGSYTFIWGQGETHTVSAPATQVDSSGRTWSFVSWSNGGPATQTIKVPATTTYALTATFAELPQVTVNSSPSGLQFTVDGSPCTTPCVVNHALGYAMPVIAPSVISSSSVSRINFTTWSDGSGASTRTITFSQSTQSFTASYQTEWAVITTFSPAASATMTFSPPTPDGFFPNGTSVTVTATPATGYKFVKWGGDLSGTYATGYLTMSGPHAITVYTQSVPAISPAGIISAAGATPDGTMAPGSVISIYGQNLAPTVQIGSTNPLPQTLANVTVSIGNYYLPLLFVSPEQINAQLPVELVDGTYTLQVAQTGQPNVPATLTISRDAPGMFTQVNPQNQPLVLALHQDGSLITFQSPALRGEQISIYGTGFGPYATTTIDGFFVPATPANNVADPVTLNIGGIIKTPDFAGAAPGAVGLTLVKMTITDDLPTATTVNLVVTVNTKPSTMLMLPLQ
jgi:uncharacterized protein (TIGR03437 family)